MSTSTLARPKKKTYKAKARTWTPATDEEKAEKLAGAHRIISEAVANLQTSEQWVEHLKFASKFYKYSFNNQILMWAQAGGRGMKPLTHVASFTAWKGLERSVQKGETGLKIFAPIIVKVRPDEEGYFPGKTKLVGFKVVSTFDIQQTEGKAIPEAPKFDYPEGEIPEGLNEGADRFGEKIGFPISFGATGSADGYTDPVKHEIVIGTQFADNPARVFRTKVHELAHALLHTAKTEDGEFEFDYRAHRGVAETEAESVAFIVADYFGVDTSSCSFHYVAGWAPTPETVVQVGTRVTKTAKTIIEALEKGPDKE